MSSQPVIHVDAFTDRPYAGNPAAVVVLSAPRETDWMQRLAQELNLPATVFLAPEEATTRIRWFTATGELPLCGHGTLAAAHTLWTEGYQPAEGAITFRYKGGSLTATRTGNWITLDFPAIVNSAVSAPEALLLGLGIEPRRVGKSHHSYLVELTSEQDVRGLSPNMTQLARLDIANVIVTARAEGGEFDFVSRYFAPSHGIAEDAVTGSAHCCLAPYWAERLNKTDMVAYQASERGGAVRVQVDGARVRLSGKAVTVLRGELLTP